MFHIKKRQAAMLLVILLGLATGCDQTPTSSTDADSGAAEDLYFVGSYDAMADPAEDVRRAVEVATMQNKRILLQVGGDWCSWCHKMSGFFHDTPEVASALRNGYVLVKINKSEENANEEFLNQYPEISGYPHLFVLENDGTLLHSQDTAELEKGSAYDRDAVMGLLTTWAPPGR
jgi:thiol:disulfide interchange protein